MKLYAQIPNPIIATAKNNTNFVKTDSVFNISKQIVNVEHFKRPKKYRLSKIGKDYIKSHETCVLHAYNDPDPNRRSVGWGHQIQPGEKLEHITQKKADELFEKDIEWVNDAINRLISQNDRRFIYTQGFIDGLNKGQPIFNMSKRNVVLTLDGVTIKNGKQTKTTLKKLKRGKKYYVRVKAYKTVNKKAVYGAKSSVKTVTVK